MKLSHIKYVLAVAEGASLRSAARQLGVAQSAVTRGIQELERELGVSLFERGTRGVTPTEIGATFIRRATAAHAEIVRAQEEVGQLRGIKHGHVVVALAPSMHVVHLPSVLRPFRTRYPNVHLEIIDTGFPSIESRVRQGTVDCYIGPEPELLAEGMIADRLFKNRRVIVGRKGHPLSHARSLRELVNAEWIQNSITSDAQYELSPLFAQHGLPPPKLVMQAHSALTSVIALVNSDLLTTMSQQFWEFGPYDKKIQAIEVREILGESSISIVVRSGLPLTPAAEYFCDLIRRSVGHAGKSQTLKR